jgi:TRAP-type C4-dicarboxylate transport system permease small subunit
MEVRVMVEKAFNIIESVLEKICIVFVGAIVASVFYAVIMRYAFHRPPAWSIELTRFLFLWMVMFGAVLVTREKSHIEITFLSDLLPPGIRKVWLFLVRLAMLCFCSVMVYYGVRILPIVGQANTPTLNLSMGWLYAAVPSGAFLMGVYLLRSGHPAVPEECKSAQSREDSDA